MRITRSDVIKLVREHFGTSLMDAQSIVMSFGAAEPGRLEIAARLLAANLNIQINVADLPAKQCMELHANAALAQADVLIAAHNVEGEQ